MRKMNKRGGVFDIPFFLLVILGLALVFFFFHFIFEKLHTQLVVTDFAQGNADSQQILNRGQDTFDGFDYMFIIIFIGMIIYIMISTGVLESSPMFIVFVLIIGTIFIIVSFVFANAWEQLETSPQLQNQTDTLQATSHVMNNLPFYMTGVVIMLLVFLYAKFKGLILR